MLTLLKTKADNLYSTLITKRTNRVEVLVREVRAVREVISKFSGLTDEDLSQQVGGNRPLSDINRLRRLVESKSLFTTRNLEPKGYTSQAT